MEKRPAPRVNDPIRLDQFEFDFDPSASPDASDADVVHLSPDERTALERDGAKFHVDLSRVELKNTGRENFLLREPCKCGWTLGVLKLVKGQNTARCAKCKTFLYNAPKTETGHVERTVRTLRSTVKPSQQARILDRDHGRCVLCGTTEDLTIC
jgi:hypothetical protein